MKNKKSSGQQCVLPFEGQVTLPDTSILQSGPLRATPQAPKKRPCKKKPHGLKSKTTITRSTTRRNKRTIVKIIYKRTEVRYGKR